MVMHRYILELIARTADKNYFKDAHPDAVACRLRLTLLCIAARTVQPWDAEEDLGGDERAGINRCLIYSMGIVACYRVCNDGRQIDYHYQWCTQAVCAQDT